MKSDFTLKYPFLAPVERPCLATLGSRAPLADRTEKRLQHLPLKATVPLRTHCFNSLDFLPGQPPAGTVNSTATTYGDNIKTMGLFNVVNSEKEMYLCICTLFVFLPLTIYVTMNPEFKWGHPHTEETNSCLLIQERAEISLGKKVVLFTLFFK